MGHSLACPLTAHPQKSQPQRHFSSLHIPQPLRCHLSADLAGWQEGQPKSCRSGAVGAHLEEALELLSILLKNFHVQVQLQAMIHCPEVPRVQDTVYS